jgi:hypothetical protein
VHPVLRLRDKALQYHRCFPANVGNRVWCLHDLEKSVDSPDSIETSKQHIQNNSAASMLEFYM